MTDYKKWDKVDFKNLGYSSSEDEAPTREKQTKEYVKSVEEIEATKARLKQLEKEKEVLEKRLVTSQKNRDRMDWMLKIGLVVFAAIMFAIQHYFSQ